MPKGKFGFEKGHSGYKPKGQPNKLTVEAKSLIMASIDNQSIYFDSTMERIRKENPIEWAKILVKLMDFVLPKQMNINMDGKIINVVPPDKRID